MPRGAAVLLLLVLLVAGACGAAPSPGTRTRTDVERGTALPPPGMAATPVRR